MEVLIRNGNFMSWALAVLWGEEERMTKGPRAGLEEMPGGSDKGRWEMCTQGAREAPDSRREMVGTSLE